MAMSELPRVAILVLNWNGWQDTIRCLESIYQLDYPNYDVIVIDNASRDGSVDKIKEYAKGKLVIQDKQVKYDPSNKPIEIFEISEVEARRGIFREREKYESLSPKKRLILIRNRFNYCYSGGNNVGLRFVSGALPSRYILILNNDVIVPQGLLKEMVDTIKKDPKIAVVGTTPCAPCSYKIMLCRRFFKKVFPIFTKSPKSRNYRDYEECNFVCGCGMLIKRETIEEVGYFDEDFFCYWEEIEWEIRLTKQGYKFLTPLTRKIYHEESKATGKGSPFVNYLFARNAILVAKKHFPQNVPLVLLVYLGPLGIAKFAKYALAKFRPKVVYYFYRGIFDGVFNKRSRVYPMAIFKRK